MPAPTLKDVALAAGVHPATASRALSPATRGMVNAQTARRILKAADSLGYRPNPIARGLKTSKSGTIGVIIPDLTNPMFPPLVRGIESVLEPAGYSCIIVNTDNDANRERSLVAALRSRQVEGLVVATAMLEHPLLDELQQQGVVMVMVNRRAEGLDVPSVSPDDANGVHLAMRHLVSLGHSRIAHLAGPSTTSTGFVRSRAFREAVRELHLDIDDSLVVECPTWSEPAGAQALRTLLDRGERFTAIVAGNDLIALGCYDVLAERHITCPDEVSVVGFNNMPFLDKLRPPLTTVAVPQTQLGSESGRMLLDALADPDRPSRAVLVPLSLAIRGSTAPPPCSRTTAQHA